MGKEVMESKGFNRKLSAILSADVKGYSRLMRSDEETTVHTLTRYREVISKLVSQYQGRVVDSPGDNILVEFASVVHAVKCGFDIQATLESENAELSEDRRMEFRLGINLGDVIQDGERIYGDGVNVAARMESLAEPGGICVAGSVYDQIEDKFAFGCEYLGEQVVKNISTPIRVYRISSDESSQGCRVRTSPRTPSKRLVLVAAICLALFIIGGVLGWSIYQRLSTGVIEAASVEQMAYPLPQKPSIAVLPFKNLSENENDALIAKGLTEDIITALARVPELFVIASASSFAYTGKSVSARQVSEELGVRYLLDGSVQRSKDRLRFTVQLVDAVGGNQIWADRFDRTVKDLFALQDDLVRRILVELQVKLTAGEFARIASRKTQNLDAWILFGQGVHEGFKFTRESMATARTFFEAARDKDPNWARPLVGLSWVYWWEARQGWVDDRNEWIRKGLELAEKAVEWAPKEPGGYQMLGMLALSKGDHAQALEYREKAFDLAPNDFVVNWGLGSVLYKAGEPERAVGVLQRAERLNPHHPTSLVWGIAEAQLMAGQYEDATQSSNRAVARKPDAVFPHIILSAAYSAADDAQAAKRESAEVLRINPKFTVSAWMKTRLLKYPADTKRISNLLVAAGLPKYPPGTGENAGK